MGNGVENTTAHVVRCRWGCQNGCVERPNQGKFDAVTPSVEHTNPGRYVAAIVKRAEMVDVGDTASCNVVPHEASFASQRNTGSALTTAAMSYA